MSAPHQYIVIDDDDDAIELESDFHLIDSDSEGSEPEIVAVKSRPSPDSSSRIDQSTNHPQDASIQLLNIALGSWKLNNGAVIKPGDTVELHSPSQQRNDMQSGDFLRVMHIIQNLATDDVRLRGHRMRRTKYFGGLFDWHLNELAIVLQVNEDDKRPPFVAGIEDVDVEEAMCLRECTLTHKPYPFLNFQSDGRYAFPATMTKDQIKRQIFHGGRLTCRLVNVQYMQGRSTKSYSGIVRHLYAHEAEKLQHSNVPSQTSLSRNGSNTVEVDDTDDCVIISKSTFAGKYPIGAEPDVEIFDKEPPRPISRHTMVKDRLTFGDAFCGAGGASQGALQAGYNVCWGIDKDDHAIEAYRLNHPGAYSLAMDAHDFPPENISKNAWRVDVLHLSPPCCYFSPAHTTDGPNDQSNYDATFTVGPILRKIKPRVATLEQTLGIVTNKQHHKTFLTLLCEIGHAGYDLRYKRWVFSELGLAQNRKRLVVIAARRGTPLPPFPNPTHGPCGSGLKPVVSIAQALYPMQRFGLRVHDPYHKLRPFHVPKPAYSPDSPLKSCITTSGTPDPHPSGTRNFTTRELSLLQSFPYTYQFVRSNTQAKVKIGNAFPPVVAEAVFRTIANTLKAVDRGIVGVQDNLDELQLELGFDDDNDSAPAGTRGPRRRGPRDEDEVIDLVGADEVIELPSDEDELA